MNKVLLRCFIFVNKLWYISFYISAFFFSNRFYMTKLCINAQCDTREVLFSIMHVELFSIRVIFN